MNLQIEYVTSGAVRVKHWVTDPSLSLLVLRLISHFPLVMCLPSCADRPPGVRGAAAVGERSPGAGEHLQDPATNFHPERKPAGLRRGQKAVLL